MCDGARERWGESVELRFMNYELREGEWEMERWGENEGTSP